VSIKIYVEGGALLQPQHIFGLKKLPVKIMTLLIDTCAEGGLNNEIQNTGKFSLFLQHNPEIREILGRSKHHSIQCD
jgi:hypothetical protein